MGLFIESLLFKQKITFHLKQLSDTEFVAYIVNWKLSGNIALPPLILPSMLLLERLGVQPNKQASFVLLCPLPREQAWVHARHQMRVFGPNTSGMLPP